MQALDKLVYGIIGQHSCEHSLPIKLKLKTLTELNLRCMSVMPSAEGTSSFSSYFPADKFTAGVTCGQRRVLVVQN
jgi:hypothetical protein